MRLHGRTVDQNLGWRPTCIRQGMKEINPYALGPNGHTDCKASCAVRGRREYRPIPARFQNVDNAADHPAAIDTGLAARVQRQMRRDPRELLLRQPETIPIYVRVLQKAVNHIILPVPISLWIRTKTHRTYRSILLPNSEDTPVICTSLRSFESSVG